MKNLLALILLAIHFYGYAQSPPVKLWKPNSLTISDFKIVGDSAKIPTMRNTNIAVTRTGITYKIIRDNSKKIKIDVFATMHPANSYMRKWILTATNEQQQYLLKHEQLHFDISEIYTRYAARKLSMARLSKDYVKEIKGMMAQLFKDAEIFQDEYDCDTKNGRDRSRQQRWNDKIERLLQETMPYKLLVISKAIL